MTYHITLETAALQGRRPLGPAIEEYPALDSQASGDPSILLTVPLASHCGGVRTRTEPQ